MVRKGNARGLPQLYSEEDAALATADTVSNTTVYSTSTSANALGKVVQFKLGSTRVTIKAGASDATVFVVVRKVPQGYSPPSISVIDGLAISDMPNVLAYGMVHVYAASANPMNRVDCRMLNRTVRMNKGDSIVVQVVSNATTTSQTYSFFCEYETI